VPSKKARTEEVYVHTGQEVNLYGGGHAAEQGVKQVEPENSEKTSTDCQFMIARLIALPQFNLFRSRSFGHVSKLMLANVFGVVLSTFTAPLVTRLYSPAAVGEFALFMAFGAILTPLFTLRYEAAIMLPKSDTEAAALLKLIERLAMAWLGLLAAAVFLSPESLFQRAGYAALYPWRLGAVLTAFLFAILLSVTASHNRAQGYGAMSASKVLQNLLYTVLVLGLGWLAMRNGQIIATMIATVVVVWWLKGRLKYSPPAMSWADTKALAWKHYHSPCYLFPATMLDNFTKQLPVFLITSWFSSELAGSFSIAWRLLFLPVGLLGAAVGQVFYQRFSQAWPNRREARRILFKTWLLLAPLAIIPCMVFMLFSPHLFAWGLGEKWRQAGVMAAVIAPVTFFVFLSSPTSGAFIVVGLQKYSLIFGLLGLFFRPACLWLGYYYQDLNLGLKAFTLVEIVLVLAYNYMIYRKLSEKNLP